MPLSALRRRASSVFACVLVASIGVAAQAHQQPPLPPDEDMPDSWFEGTIGNNLRVRMYVGAPLWTAGFPREATLWGAYFYNTQRKLIPLDGATLPSGIVRLFEGARDNPGGRAVFDLNLTQHTTVSGAWTSADGVRRLPVRLRRIAKPKAYANALRNPRTFQDPRWPFTFKYPAEWSLQVTRTTLQLQSADPLDMLLGDSLYCERGGKLPQRPRAGTLPVPFEGSFYRAHDGWVVQSDMLDSCDESDSRCVKPNTRRRDATVMMDTSMGYRSHSPWGYAGLKEASEYLVIAGSAWAHCIDGAFEGGQQPVRQPAPLRPRLLA
jgi:hypothetical protein